MCKGVTIMRAAHNRRIMKISGSFASLCRTPALALAGALAAKIAIALLLTMIVPKLRQSSKP
jgi:hypothetical protein